MGDSGGMALPADLLAAARAHEAYFCALLDRIPAHLAMPRTEEEEEESGAARFYKVCEHVETQSHCRGDIAPMETGLGSGLRKICAPGLGNMRVRSLLRVVQAWLS